MNNIKVIMLFFLLISSLSCINIKKTIPLETRVLTYWHIKQTGNYTIKEGNNFTSIYFEYLTSESKSKLTEKDYYSRLNAKVKNISIYNIDYINESSAIVTIKYNLNFKGYDLKGVKIKEKWLFENGKWVVFVNPNSNPFWKSKL